MTHFSDQVPGVPQHMAVFTKHSELEALQSSVHALPPESHKHTQVQFMLLSHFTSKEPKPRKIKKPSGLWLSME
jgi:hypothetical protein